MIPGIGLYSVIWQDEVLLWELSRLFLESSFTSKFYPIFPFSNLHYSAKLELPSSSLLSVASNCSSECP